MRCLRVTRGSSSRTVGGMALGLCGRATRGVACLVPTSPHCVTHDAHAHVICRGGCALIALCRAAGGPMWHRQCPRGCACAASSPLPPLFLPPPATLSMACVCWRAGLPCPSPFLFRREQLLLSSLSPRVSPQVFMGVSGSKDEGLSRDPVKFGEAGDVGALLGVYHDHNLTIPRDRVTERRDSVVTISRDFVDLYNRSTGTLTCARAHTHAVDTHTQSYSCVLPTSAHAVSVLLPLPSYCVIGSPVVPSQRTVRCVCARPASSPAHPTPSAPPSAPLPLRAPMRGK